MYVSFLSQGLSQLFDSDESNLVSLESYFGFSELEFGLYMHTGWTSKDSLKLTF